MSGAFIRNVVAGMTNRVGAIIETGGGAFNPAAYGTVTDHWESTDLTGTGAADIVVANQIAARPSLVAAGGGAISVQATGWNGNTQSVRVPAQGNSVLYADLVTALSDFYVALVFDQTTDPTLGLDLYPFGWGHPVDGNCSALHSASFPYNNDDAARFVDTSGTMGAAGSLSISGKQVWIIHRTAAGPATLYRNGVSVATHANPGARLQYTNVGSYAASTSRGFGGEWRSAMVFSSLTSTVAQLNTALTTFYGV